MAVDKQAITLALRDWNSGSPDAEERLVPMVYDELKRQARILMRRERSSHTLQPTALVNEVFLRLTKVAGIEWENRSHFYGIASRLMRQILVDHARKNSSVKRGSGVKPESLEDIQIGNSDSNEILIAVDEALARLFETNSEQAKIVEMKFFGGMTTKEVSESLSISERSVGRKWKAARLWLYKELHEKMA